MSYPVCIRGSSLMSMMPRLALITPYLNKQLEPAPRLRNRRNSPRQWLQRGWKFFQDDDLRKLLWEQHRERFAALS